MANEYIVEVNDNPTITIDGWNVKCDDMFIQREQITRCKDCKHFDNHSRIGAYCKFFAHSLYDDYNGFCAWGKNFSEK